MSAPLEVFYRIGPDGWVDSVAALQDGRPAVAPLTPEHLPFLPGVSQEIRVALEPEPIRESKLRVAAAQLDRKQR